MSTDSKFRFEENTKSCNIKVLFPATTASQPKNDNVNICEKSQFSGSTKATTHINLPLSPNNVLTNSGSNTDERKLERRRKIIIRRKRQLRRHIRKYSEHVREIFVLERNALENYLDLKIASRKSDADLSDYLEKYTLEAKEPEMLKRSLFDKNNSVEVHITRETTVPEVEISSDIETFNKNFLVINEQTQKDPPIIASPFSDLLGDGRGTSNKPFGSSMSKLPSSSPLRENLSVNSDPQLFQSPPPSVPRLVQRSEVMSDDDIILSGNTPATYEDTPVKRWSTFGPSPKPPKKYSEKMKAEASVMQRIQELQKEGMWYDKRLPKCHEPSRIKAHWDYLLEEMTWLSNDFVYERKWKILAAKKCSKMIEKYFNDRAIATQRAEKEEEVRKRRQCAYVAKEIKNFWSNAQKLVEMSEKSRIELLRKKALDVHLSFIVKQTEKYSNMLAETLSTSVVTNNNTNDSSEESAGSPHHHSEEDILEAGDADGDDDFEPMDSEEDDEETISTAEEEAAKDKASVDKEVELLAEESEIPIDDFLDMLPEGYLDWRLKNCNETSDADMDLDRGTSDEANPGKSAEASKDFKDASTPDSDSEFEDAVETHSEVTSKTPEQLTGSDEKAAPVVQELSLVLGETNKQLKSKEDGNVENDAKTEAKSTLGKQSKVDVVAVETDPAVGKSKDDTQKESASEVGEEDYEMESDEEGNSNSESEDYDSNGSETEVGTDEDEDPDQTTGLASLLQTFAPERAGEDHEDHINSVAAEAESFQPKGYTLTTTTVVTKVPFLLKHTLREYQHIGLDWLVAMYTKKLNGILADEMGLGKTIQTIALLAHLACEKGNWGPHLIVVPTSVMLNWEMEFKKWCPGFKILTYYGLQKERKLKRQGWTKPNTFHVCITSYKLVIQDHQSFRRKRWKYLILDEAQNIKNFKSQRWQLLLNFQTQRRLLLTGTPLQNNLMELWSLMHFLMPNVFQSHREFREWFSDPVSHMVEGNSSYDDNIIQRLHKVLRPFILRRLKSEVEKQLPQKYNHVILCRLSKRQRYLYEEYMERANTRETLNKGNLLSVINVLMQLRKVCNHPNLFEPRPIISPFQVVGIECTTPSLVWNIMDEHRLYSSPTFTMFKMTEYDFAFSKEDGHRISEERYSFRYELEESEDCVKDEKPNGVETTASSTETPVIETMEVGKRPPLKKPKREPPPIPVVDQGFPFFMTTVDPTPFLKDPEFVSAVGYDAPDRGLHSHLVNGGSKRIKMSVPSKPKVGDFNSAMKARVKNKFDNVENTIDGEDSLREDGDMNGSLTEAERYQNNEFQTLGQSSSKSCFTRILPKFDAQNMTPAELRILKAKYTMMVNYKKHLKAQSLMTEPRKRKSCLTMRSVVKPWLQSIGIPSADCFLTADMQQRTLKDRRDLIVRLKSINEERCKVMPVIGRGTKDVCQLYDSAECGKLIGGRRARRRKGFRPVRVTDKGHHLEGLYHLGYSEMKMALFMKICTSQNVVNNPHLLWRMTKGIMNLTWTLQEQLSMLSEIIKRFVIYVPAVSVPNPFVSYFRPTATYYAKQMQLDRDLVHNLRKPAEILHPIVSRMSTQFPDPRLIEYDCGKLQVLNRLLRALKAEDHRVLLFTQMAKMLDVLEAFLNYHGHIYLRLDGATKIEDRQILMERFNTDKRIFCFILSTRSGGIGVNLTGADTVIFYDSDWNPTMDAQAQDRCHRIGQTRDVNIYRLVSERTIEENILKKSNQKRILGELAIEGGNFTTAYFKKDSIFDLFNVDSFESDPLTRIRNDLESNTSVMDSSGMYTRKAKAKLEAEAPPVLEDQQTTQLFECALAEAEDETDVQAARTVQAEAAAELAEFDENIPLEDLQDGELEDNIPKLDLEMSIISAELIPVERYALRFMEHYIDEWSRETVSTAKKEIENQKREWELEQLRKSEAERIAKECPEDEDRVVMGPDSYVSTKSICDQQVRLDDSFDNIPVPLWAPPTPPTDDSDVYIDMCQMYLYSSNLIPEHELPPVYVPRAPKQPKKPTRQIITAEKRDHAIELDMSVWKENHIQTPFPADYVPLELDEATSSKKTPKVQRRDEPIFAPRSLFDRPSPALAKLRRDFRMQKYNPSRPVSTVPKLGAGAITFPITSPPQKPMSPPVSDNSPEWTISEDHALYQAVSGILELPLSLMVVNLAQTPNWDLAAEMVNLSSKTYRTAKQCKYRYETVVGPRDEGKLFFEAPAATPTASSPQSPTVKKKKSKAFIKIGPPSPTRAARLKTTSQLMAQDNNSQISTAFTQKFDYIKSITNRKVPTNKPMTVNPHVKQSKQAAIFAEHGINYDNPLPATTIAQTRFERLQMERKKLIAAQQAAAAAAAASANGGVLNSPTTNASLLPGGILSTIASSNVSQIPPAPSPVQGSLQLPGVNIGPGGHVGVGLATSQTAVEVLQKTRQLNNRLNLSQQSVQLQHQLQILQHNQLQQAKHKQIQFALAHPQQSQVVTAQPQGVNSPQHHIIQTQQQAIQMKPQQQSQTQQPTVVLSAGLAQALGTTVGSQVNTPGGTVTMSTVVSNLTATHSVSTASPRNQQLLQSQQHLQQQQQQQQQQQLQPLSTITMHDLVSVASPQRLNQTMTTMATTTLQSQSTPSTIVSLTPGTVIGTGQQITKLVPGHATLVSASPKGTPTSGTVTMKGSNVNTMQLQFVRSGALIRQPSTVTTASQQQQLREQMQNQQIKRIQVVTSTGQTAIVSSANITSGVGGVTVSGSPTLSSSTSTITTQQNTHTTSSMLPVSLVPASPMMTVSTSTPLGTVATVVTPGSTRQVQLVRQTTVGGKTVTRAISESEVAAILKQHGLQNSKLAIASSSGGGQLGGQKGQVTQVQVPVGSLGNMPTHTLLTSVNLQNLGFKMQQTGSGSPVATIVKTSASQAGQSGTAVFPLTLSQVKNVGKATTVTTKQQQMQLNLQHQLLNQQRRQQQQQQQQQQQNANKITHITQVTPQGTMPTQLIVQATPKQLQNAMAQQQFNQVFKQVTSSGQILSQSGQVLQAHMMSKPISVGNSPTTMAVTSSASGNSVIGTGNPVVSQGQSVTVSANLMNPAGQNVHARIVPVSSPGLKPSIQVVSAPNTILSTGNLARPQITSTPTSISFTNIKMTPSLAQNTPPSMQGQPLSIRLQTSTGITSSSTITSDSSPTVTTLSSAVPSTVTTMTTTPTTPILSISTPDLQQQSSGDSPSKK